MPNILTGFLAANLLPIGEDDEKLTLLEDAAGDLAKEIKSKPILAHRFAMVGLDERVPATDPVHKKVGDAIANKWQTMTNKTGAGPVQVHRAVMLRSIEMAAAENRLLRFAITLIARNQPVAVAEGKATAAISAMLAGWESSVAEEMTNAWVNPVEMSLPKLTAKLKKTQAGKEELSLALSRATGPQDKEGRALNNPNPNWPNAGQPWSYEFVSRATDGIHAAIQTGGKSFAEDMQEALRETVQGLVASLERLAVRDAKAELLWIRASMYSPSARRSYRSLDANGIVLHAVLDINRSVTSLAPPSVEFFLRDLVAELAPARGRLAEALPIIGREITSMPEGQLITTGEQLPAEGRRSWLDYAVRGKSNGPFEEQIGAPSDYEVQLSELAIGLYRELQIRKLLTPAP